MTTLSPHPHRLPATDAVTEDRWTTPVWLGTVHPAVDHDLLHSQMIKPPTDRRALDPGDVLDTDKALTVLTALAQTIRPGAATTAVRLGVEIWAPGHRVPLAYGHGDWTAWCYLATAGDAPHESSAALCLHDPRAGCDSATVPGLPWGRALTLRAQTGLTVVAPGWLAHSVLPVAEGHTVVVLTART
ncbi:hypothetical protein [Streptomyces sp. NPDC056883]|uniref:hypothetical protein n=1 Tax=Streptomyces sp. NPDC056883 TaxID=3345959 RepID=UPI0036801727